MTDKPLSWPIRRILVILLLLLALPSMLLIIRSGIEARNNAIDDAKEDSLRLVEAIAYEEQNVIAGMQQLVTTLAVLPAVQSHKSKAANALLSELVKKNPQYNNIAITDKSGLVWASGVPVKGQVSLANRRYFQGAVRTGMFSSGEYSIGRIVNEAHLGFGYPVKNTADEIIAIIAVTLNLDYAQKTFENLKLPLGSSFSLLDHQGVILIRNLKDVFSEKLIGKRDIREELFTIMTEGPDEGTWEAMGNDDQVRLSAYKRISLPHESKPYLYVRSSVPLASAISQANAAMLKNLAVFTMLFLFALFLASFIGNRMILRPVMMLKKASEQLGAGADTINVSDLVKGGELGELAQTFDNMSETLVRREIELRESEQKYRSVVENSMDAILITKEDGTILSANPAAGRILGMSEEEIIKINREDIIDPDDPRYEKAREEGARTGKIRSELNLIRKDGSKFIAEVTSSFYPNPHGNVLASVMLRDVTERKRAEETLRKERDFSTAVLDTAGALIIVLDGEGRIMRFNHACEEITGYAAAEVLGREFMDLLVPEEDIPGVQKEWKSLCAGDLPSRHENYWVSKDGSKRLIAWSNAAITRDDGNIDYVIGTGVDITERKLAEDKLRKEEEQSRQQLIEIESIYDSAPVGLCVFDRELRFVRINKRLAEINGIPAEDHIGKTVQEVVPSLAPLAEDIERRIFRTGETVIQEFSGTTASRPDVQRFWIETWSPLKDDNGSISGINVVIEEITERKRAEEALIESEKRFSAAFYSSPEPIVISTVEGRYIDVNESWVKTIGYTREELIGRTSMDLSIWADPQGRKPFAEKLKNDGFLRNESIQIRTKSGEIRDFVWYADIIHISGEELMLSQMHDITEQKRMENILRDNEERFRTLVSASSESLYTMSPDWNEMRQLNSEGFLVKTEKASRSWMEEYILPDDQPYVTSKINEAIRMKSTFMLEHRVRREDGSLGWTFSRVVPLMDDKGEVVEWFGSANDITDIKMAQDALRRSRDELEQMVRERTTQLIKTNKTLLEEIQERKRSEEELLAAQQKLRAMATEIVLADERSRQHFAADLHDTVVQTLGAAKLKSQLIQDSIPSETKPVYTELQDMISHSIIQSRLIMAEMSPPVLNELGFAPALEWLTEQVEAQHGISIDFTASKNGSQALAHEIQVLLFQATRELLMNIVKHSQAERAVVKLSGNHDRVRIEVTDKGVGFDEQKAFRTDTSGGFGLFSIRERLRYFGGELKIRTKPGEGTCVVMTAPRIIEK